MKQTIVNQIHQSLLKNGKTVAVAESCSGGLASSLLTQASGSSQSFILGVVVYSKQAKIKTLKIPPSLLAKKGAVSSEIALRLAQNVRKLAKSDFGIGITGIAGPSGGTPKKPVGTVFIAVSSHRENISKEFHFKGSRHTIRNKTALKSLELLKELIIR